MPLSNIFVCKKSKMVALYIIDQWDSTRIVFDPRKIPPKTRTTGHSYGALVTCRCMHGSRSATGTASILVQKLMYGEDKIIQHRIRYHFVMHFVSSTKYPSRPQRSLRRRRRSELRWLRLNKPGRTYYTQLLLIINLLKTITRNTTLDVR